jgi:hypothetical protein
MINVTIASASANINWKLDLKVKYNLMATQIGTNSLMTRTISFKILDLMTLAEVS